MHMLAHSKTRCRTLKPIRSGLLLFVSDMPFQAATLPGSCTTDSFLQSETKLDASALHWAHGNLRLVGGDSNLLL